MDYLERIQIELEDDEGEAHTNLLLTTTTIAGTDPETSAKYVACVRRFYRMFGLKVVRVTRLEMSGIELKLTRVRAKAGERRRSERRGMAPALSLVKVA